MEKSSREKMGLVALLLLVVLIGVCSCAYMNTAKTWTVAASHVDDAMGSMDGYAVILYPGTTQPEPEESYVPKAEGGLFSSLADSAAEDSSSVAEEPSGVASDALSLEGSQAVSDASPAEAGLSSAASDTAPSSTDALPASEAGRDATADAADESTSDEEPLSEGEVKAKSFAERFLPLISDATEEDPDPLFVSDVRTDYLEKEASVLTIDALNAGRYAEPGVFMLEGKRVGVFSVNEPISQTRLNVFKEFFAQKKADIVVCLTPLGSYLASFEGIDIVVVTTAAENAYSTIGSEKEGAFVVRAPELGSVGVVFITSNNVVSSKVVDEL